MCAPFSDRCYFFFNDTATTEIYTLSLHDALPISPTGGGSPIPPRPAPSRSPPRLTPTGSRAGSGPPGNAPAPPRAGPRSEEHTSELQSHLNLVCRLLLEKKTDRYD